VLFPSTSISRRVEAGTPVDIRALYQKSVRTIERARARGIKPY
jgi:hypothetical protein